MRAVVYTRYGPPSVLEVQDREKPEPRDDQVLIRVQAAEVTKADCELRAFRFPVKWTNLPLRLAWGVRAPRRQILGGYLAGVVDAVGARVSRFQVGDAVFGANGFEMGAHAEYVAVSEGSALVPKPANITFEEAAAVPLGGLNAIHFLRLAAVGRGERVLVNGAGGSIGLFAVQIAKSVGAHVTAVDAPHKRDLLADVGADDFIDYTRGDFWADGATYDIVFDVVASSSYRCCIGVLAPGGHYATANPTMAKMLRSVWTSRFTDKQVHVAFARESIEEMSALAEMLEAGTIRGVVDQVFPLERAAAAHERVETEQRLGSVVLQTAREV